MPKIDPDTFAHLEWLEFVQPTGLVVSPTALVRAGAILLRRDTEGQQRLRECLAERRFAEDGEPAPWLPDFRAFATSVLGWSFAPADYAGTSEHSIPPELHSALSGAGEMLRPDFAVREPEPQDGKSPWQLVVCVAEPGTDLDRIVRGAGSGSVELSPHGRMERLLRQTRVTAGLLFNGRVLRLVSAPQGESSGWLDFRVADMAQPAGRPICAAMRLLLGESRLLALLRPARLAALLEDSRKYQNEVSERLAQQVLHALYELLRGYQSAHDASGGTLLRQVLADDPDRVYRAMLTVVLRLVFVLYAEERALLPGGEVYLRHYALAGLFARLREDAALYPDTMNQRYGAWAQLVVLFRMIHDGAHADELRLPRRHGALFDPDRFPFLEGRTAGGARQVHERIEPPRVPDRTVLRALEKLLVLDGERLSYRALDVEQIGSVYETMMGFRLRTAAGRSVAIKSPKPHGAPTTVDLEALAATAPVERAKQLQDETGRKLTETVKRPLAAARSIEDVHAALRPVIDAAATPDLVPAGAMVLQPSDERRRSGSHYTPRALTAPIVQTTLQPILARLRGAAGAPPRPEQILDLKVCDPAMGSGAFLVEACRQLGDALVESWRAHGELPSIPPDEDETIFARRLVAQRCLYGVDRNPVAVDLAKVSLWLVTLAKDHPLTFLDHALRHGDSLVGLSLDQIKAFHWDTNAPATQRGFEWKEVQERLRRVAALRQRIRAAGESVSDRELRDLWDQAATELEHVTLIADLVVAAWFEAGKARDREARRTAYGLAIATGEAVEHRSELNERRHAEPPLAPFHWPIEFPEVFERAHGGFDAIVGNPPFAGKNTIGDGNVDHYPDWLQQLHAESHGNADLVAHFYRRAFDLLGEGGAFGLIATNTIAQGDTRSTGMRWICTHGGEIYHARKRLKWPGLAAVVVSVVHVMKGNFAGTKHLDDQERDTITAFLFHRGAHDDPARLAANADKSFQGSIVLGMGFTFDDTDKKGVATPLAEMRRLIERNSRNAEVIFPYIGGEEVNTSPTHAYHRYVINFGSRSEGECRTAWPELMTIVDAKVKPRRATQASIVNPARWWMFARSAADLATAVAGLERVLVIPRLSECGAFAFLPSGMVFSEQLVVIPLQGFAAFCALQSRPHEIWARFFGSTLEDRLRYTPSDCFETFPFPKNWETHPALEAAGKTCYEFRAALMVRNDEGLTATYNRFHDPEERDAGILKLRELHAAMDRAVLEAYGWSDIATDCEFLLDYEIDEEEWGDRRKPWRYRWPDAVRDEVLARLLELNAQRAGEETKSGATATGLRRVRRSRAPAEAPPDTGGLFP